MKANVKLNMTVDGDHRQISAELTIDVNNDTDDRYVRHFDHTYGETHKMGGITEWIDAQLGECLSKYGTEFGS